MDQGTGDAIMVALVGIAATNIIALIWTLSSIKTQTTSLVTAVDKLERAVTSITRFQGSVQQRIARIETRCRIHHTDDDEESE